MKKASREEVTDEWASSYSNPYTFNAMEEEKPKPPPGSVRYKTREEKYAEDVLKLHEAYQVWSDSIGTVTSVTGAW